MKLLVANINAKIISLLANKIANWHTCYFTINSALNSETLQSKGTLLDKYIRITIYCELIL